MKCSSLVVFLLLAAPAPVKASVRGIRGVRKRNLQLQLVGFGGEPNDNRFPLQLCQGDCDNDEECDIGLVCFQRDPPPAGGSWPEVPGCIGGSDFTAQTDFCILGPISSIVGVPTNAPTLTPSVAPSGKPSNSPVGVPSNSPSNVPTKEVLSTGPTTESPSVAPTTASPSLMPSSQSYWDLPEVDFVGNDGNLEGMPLGLCQGDCDVDDDCLDDMICFQRAFNEPIPGCRGNARSSMDYCILPPVILPEEPIVVTLSPTTAETMAATEMIVALQTIGDANGAPLGLCQGDCDVDEDCLDDLICFQRNFVEPVPGCAGQGAASYDYCILNPLAAVTPSPTQSFVVTFAPPTEQQEQQQPSLVPTQLPLVIEALEQPPSSIPTTSQAPSTQPSPEPLLAIVHKEKEGPLGLCEGKCYSDEDCVGDLICMDRESEDEVPGCGGEPNKADDYCINA